MNPGVGHCRESLCVLVVMGSGSVLVCGSTKYVYHKVPASTNNMPVIGAWLNELSWLSNEE